MPTDPDITAVTFYFDPSCPWTWRTSRWLVDVTERVGVPIAYRAFELSNGGSLADVPEQFRASAVASRPFLRAVEAAHADDRDDVIAAFYTAYGTKLHDEGSSPTTALVKETLRAAGGEKYLPSMEDSSLDASMAQARAAAQRFSGDDSGSPVTVLSSAEDDHGFFGPVLAPVPTDDDADRLWDVLVTAASLPQFFELKARRTAQP